MRWTGQIMSETLLFHPCQSASHRKRWVARGVTRMSDCEKHIQQLFAAELQFRLASAVRLAVTGNVQPLDLPMEWTHGQHRVRYEEIALRQDQADYAASFLHRSATYLMASP